MSVEAAKRALRVRMRAGRRGRAADAGQRIADLVLGVLPAGPVALYLSRTGEPPTAPLIGALGERLLLAPRVEGDALVWCELGASELTESRLGIAEPTGPAIEGGLGLCAAIVIPALAADRAGCRLGQGGGFFDRALASVPRSADGGPLRIALIFEDELLDEIPAEPHDQLVDVLVTEVRIVQCSSSTGAP